MDNLLLMKAQLRKKKTHFTHTSLKTFTTLPYKIPLFPPPAVKQ